MAVVADSSPLILFARAGQLPLLHQLFDELWIPPRVSGEVFLDAPDRPGATEVATVFGDWIREVAPTNLVAVTALRAVVDPGEAEAIALAVEHDLLLLIDEPDGRRAARERGVLVTGCVGILELAKRHGIVPMVRPLLDELLAEGLRLAPSLYRQVLEQVGELPRGGPPP